ncbi:uncharacterized protein LOC115725980 [Rhodamnia argentea]|uniref:Uncharacterized protein LOC115725980 n=1 Tax=Rhodamnia argentea TaxID=178133 RepID=A0ABM3HRJ4_9MYRT|nr:uncharacterized protein LOC115725980 [Rhodamnia argentea]
MPIGDPRAGRAFIWLVASFILLCLAIGGGFLIRYMSLPESTSSSWLLYAGMILVGFPWLFWLLTCGYRCISRICGFRFVCGGGDDGGSNHKTASGSIKVGSSHVDSPGNGGKQVHFGAAVVVNQNDHNDQDGNSFHDVSIRSHESEIPLASSMAS